MHLIVGAVFVLSGINAFSQPTVTTLANTFLFAGSGSASTTPVLTTSAKFNFPAGIALDPSGTRLFVADYNNNAVRMVNNLGNKTTSYTFSIYTNKDGISHPIAVAVDAATNIYVLNYGSGTNGSLLVYNGFDYINYSLKTLVSTNAIRLTNAVAMTMDGLNNIYIAVNTNKVIRVTPAGVTTVVGVITNAGTQLRGLAYLSTGKIAITDSGTNGNGIWLMNPANPSISNNAVKFTGFHGIGDTNGPASVAAFHGLENILRAGGDVLVVSDRYNNKVKLVDTNGTVTRLFGVNSNYWNNVSGLSTKGWNDGTVYPIESADKVQADQPYGLAIGADGTVYDTEVYYHLLREATGTGLTGPGPLPLFYGPAGIATDNLGSALAIADQNNNAIRLLNLGNNQTTTFLNSSNGISLPASVLYDADNNLYILNQNNGTNGSILSFDYPYGNLLATNATGLNQPTAFTMDANGNIFVAEQSGAIRTVFPSGVINTLVTITNANVSLQGIAIFDDGMLAVSDAGNHVLWVVNPLTKVVSKLTGQLGTSGNTLGASNFAKLFLPHQLARMGGNQLVIADTGNNRLVTVARSGSVTNVLNSTNASVWFGQTGDPYASSSSKFVQMVSAVGVAVSSAGKVFASETYYNDIRGLNATVTAPSAVPNVILPYFITPAGIAFDAYGEIFGPYGVNNLFVADSVDNEVKVLDLDNNYTSSFLSGLDGITNPVSVLVDTNENIYVLNQNGGANGYISSFDIYGNPLGTVATGLTNATAFVLDGYGNFFVTEQAGNLCVFGTGISNTLVTITNAANVSLQGIALFDDGTIAVSDAGNHVIWTVNAITKAISKLTGQLGVSGTNFGSAGFAKLNQPRQLVRAGGNQLLVADYGNNRLVPVARNGSIAYALNSTNASVWFGQTGDPILNSSLKFVPMVKPWGVAIGGSVVYASETYYDDVRGLTGSAITAPAFNPGVPLPYYSGASGIALNSTATKLFIADPTNNTVSVLNLANNQTTLFLGSTNGIQQPVDVALDSSDNLYVLNQGTGGNGSILEFDKYGNLLGTNVTGLSLPTAMKLTFAGDLYVSELTGAIQKFSGGTSNTLVTVTNVNVQLQGIALLDNGSVVVSDAGNHVLWKITNSASATNVVLFTGIVSLPGNTFGAAGFAKLNKPMRLAQAQGGLLLIADSGNNRVVVCDDLGTVSTALNSTNATLWFGNPIDPVSALSPYFVSMYSPVGLAIGNSGTVFDSESIYKDIRGILNTGILPPVPPPSIPLNLVAIGTYGQVALTWTTVTGATNYNVKRSPSSGGPSYSTIGTTSATSYTDTNVINGSSYYYVVSAVNAGGESGNSVEAGAYVPLPPIPDPQIGYVDFPATASPTYTSVFHPVSSYDFYNDTSIVIKGTPGSGTYYEYAYTSNPTNVANPTTNSPGQVPSDYNDGLNSGSISPYLVSQVAPDLTIKAFGAKSDGSPNSSTVTATFHFITGNPTITGNNAGQFFINDITANAELYYTFDGSTPASTNVNAVHLPAVATPTNLWTVGFAVTSNTTFKVIAVHSNYRDSAVVSTVFSPSNFVANTISFGFANGEASSDFVASPGQTFYAPVTLSPLSGTKIYSLQFNLTVTNLGSNAVAPGQFDFTSMLKKPVPGLSDVYTPIPPLAFVSQTPPTVTTNVVFYNGNYYANLLFTNPSINLLGVGWVERYGQTNLYNTRGQDLITYSFAHDVLFLSASGKVEVGGYSFAVPVNATSNDVYQIQINRPSATSDGVGAPGSDVYIAAPTNGAIAGGSPVNALKQVTIGQRKYIAGSVYPFRWFNAGDFGSTNIVSADVEQVFEAAIYGTNVPPAATDFYDGMDSCGNFGVLDTNPIDPNYNYYTNAMTFPNPYSYPVTSYTYTADTNGVITTNLDVSNQTQPIFISSYSVNYTYYITNISLATPPGLNQTNVSSAILNVSLTPTVSTLFDGSDTSISQIAFGDGVLDVCDVYVTYRRSLDPTLTWFRRFWNNGQRVADTVPNVAAHALLASKGLVVQPKVQSSAPVQVNFAAGDIAGSAGQKVQIPITATILGSYPLRVLMLNLTVVPLDGSPDLTSAVQFTQNPALGSPYSISSKGNDNYAAAWLNSTNTGLTGTANIGTLSFTIPAGAPSNAAYAVHFDHISASPNGLASFPKQTLTGLISLSSHTNSSYGDGIPDSWRLRWFGTTNNLLSISNACPSGDGVNNWKKYVAGIDPNVANNFPSVKAKLPIPSSFTTAIHWPTVSGKQYVIERSTSLFPGAWSAIATNTGTGTDLEFDDNFGGSVKFYRVRILP